MSRTRRVAAPTAPTALLAIAGLFALAAVPGCYGPQKPGGPAKLDAPVTGSSRVKWEDSSLLDRMNFEVKWRLETRKHNFIAMTLQSDALFALTADHALYSIDIDEGVINWIYTIGEPLTAPPIVYRYPQDPDDAVRKIDELYLMCGDQMRVLDLDVGEDLWRIDLPFSVSSAPTGTSARIVLGGWDDRFYAIKKDPPRGKVWHWLSKDDVVARGAAHDPIFLGVSRDGGIYAFNQQGGEFRWRIDTRGPIVAEPVVHQARLYVGSEDYSLYSIDLTRAAIEWRYETGGPIRRPPVVIGDAVYVIPDDRKMVAIRRAGNPRERSPDEPVSGDAFWTLDVGKKDFNLRTRSRVLTRGRDNVYVLNDRKQVLAVHHDTGSVLWEAPFGTIDFFATNPFNIASRNETEKARGGTIFLGMRSGWFYAIREKSEY